MNRIAAQIIDKFAEFTVVGSYSNLGYKRRQAFFDPADLEVNLQGRNFIVTGANSGIGFSTALSLAQHRAQVILLCRNPKRATEAARRIKNLVDPKTPDPIVVIADLSDLNEVKKSAKEILALNIPLHGLIHNAGNGLEKKQLNKQNVDSMFATNVLASFLLTKILLPHLRNSSSAEAPSRALWVSSGGMYTAGLRLDDLQWDKRPYEWIKVYAENKRAQVCMAEAFAAEEPKPAKVVFNSMHPGWVDTDLVRNHLPQFEKTLKKYLRTPEQGADTLVWLAMSSAAGRVSGKFWLDRKARRTVILPGTSISPAERARLMEICAEFL